MWPALLSIGIWLVADALASLWVFRQQRVFPEQAVRACRLLIGGAVTVLALFY